MASNLFLPPVADTLLLQFKSLAKAKGDAASPQVRSTDHCSAVERDITRRTATYASVNALVLQFSS